MDKRINVTCEDDDGMMKKKKKKKKLTHLTNCASIHPRPWPVPRSPNPNPNNPLPMVQIATIVGSLRAGRNAAVMRFARETLPQGVTFAPVAIDEFPLYNES
jgi:hypothetical protein